jgi:DHA1 family bicyclomycin/chloramphenicol resistance-like MFS transporter
MNTELVTKRRFVLVLGLLTGLAAVSIDMSLPAIPEMVLSLGTNMQTGQQIVGLFLAGIALGQVPAGLMSDRYGRMPVLYTGVGIFVLAGIASALAGDIELILIARFIQGVGASVGVVVSRAIVRDITSGKQAARMLSVMVMIFTAAPMLAPVIGALLVTHYGWRMPFVAVTIFGALIFFSVSSVLRETHVPTREHHIIRHLAMSVREFFGHRQCILGVLLVLLPAAGFMALITGSAALIIEVYGINVRYFGYIFALAGFAILTGSMLNRHLLQRFSGMQMMTLGAGLIGIAGVQMLIFAWLGQPNFYWVWGTVCLFMVGTGFLMPNATALALDPVPKVAGVAASILGTIQNMAGATSAIVSSALYDGTILNMVLFMGVFGVATCVTFLLRHLLLGDRQLYVA